MDSADPSYLTEHAMRTLWPSFKRRLQARFPGEGNWIRSMYLLRCLRANEKQIHLLASVPANGRIIREALDRLPVMREMLAPNFCISLTVAPDEWHVSEARRRFGIELLPRTNPGRYGANRAGVLL
jgi:hypothetical protein